ncbi:MAG: FGGY family carbohydrate kinase [Tsuneonella sp.]
MPELLLALDAGTTGARAMLVDAGGAVLGGCKQPIASRYPAPGLVEQDAEAVWAICRAVIDGALAAAGRTIADVAAMGVTTQRASVVVWDRVSGRPAAPMIVWSDLRGLEAFRALKAAGFAGWPQVPSAKLPAALALAGCDPATLQWGTLDSWLVYKLSGAHVTDASAAWLTGYYDFAAGHGWDAALLAHQGLPAAMFPAQVASWGPVAQTDAAAVGAKVPITALIADQQAALVAHGALSRGDWAATYGTSGVLMACTGGTPEGVHRSMPPEVLAAADGGMRFCVEGMVITAGSLIEWLCGGLGLFASPAELERAAAAAPAGEVFVRPTLAGMGAPHGQFDVRGLIGGLSFAAGPGEIARAALQAIAYRFREIADVIAAALPVPAALPVAGGLSASDTLLQIQADALQRPVRRHAVREASAYGAALAAGMGAELFAETDLKRLARYEREFLPRIGADEADSGFAKWRAAVAPC